MKKVELERARIIPLDGGKKDEELSDAKLEIEGEKIELGSFILSGEDKDGKRLLYTWNCSADEMCAYLKSIDVVVTNKVKMIMGME